MKRVTIALPAMVLMGLGGCINGVFPIPGIGFDEPIAVEVFNNSDFDVVPDIRFDPDNDLLALQDPREFLDIGSLIPGEFIEFEFDCDRLGTIFSDETEVYFLGEFIGLAEPSDALQFGDAFTCGDFIQIEFIGVDDFFEIVLRVNGVVVGSSALF